MSPNKENGLLKKAAILSLSLLMLTHTSISTSLPTMYEYYNTLDVSRVDLIVTTPTTFVILIMILNVIKNGFLGERQLIISGLFLTLLAGTAPMFCQNYYFVLCTRALLGIGIGFMNIRVVSMVSERYEGDEKATLMGYRSSMEAVGNAVMIFLVGRLLLTGWTHIFAIYFAAVPILILYLIGMKGDKGSPAAIANNKSDVNPHFDRKSLKASLKLALLGVLFILVSMTCSLRLAVLAVEKGYGTETQASVIMSLLMLVGIVSGIVYGKLRKILGRNFLMCIMAVCAGGLLIIAFAGNLLICGLGAVVVGFCYTTLVSIVFTGISEEVPTQLVDRATSVVLLGCNFGSAASPFFMKLMTLFGASAMIPFIFLAALLLVLTAFSLLKR